MSCSTREWKAAVARNRLASGSGVNTPTLSRSLFRAAALQSEALAIYYSNSLHLNEPFRADQPLDNNERADGRSFDVYKTVPYF
jgi:hypothetical protein